MELDPGMQFFSVLDADGELAREKDPHMTGNPDSDSDSEGHPGYWVRGLPCCLPLHDPSLLDAWYSGCSLTGEVEIRQDDHVFVAASCEDSPHGLVIGIPTAVAAGKGTHQPSYAAGRLLHFGALCV